MSSPENRDPVVIGIHMRARAIKTIGLATTSLHRRLSVDSELDFGIL
jgi:hypothetical protein